MITTTCPTCDGLSLPCRTCGDAGCNACKGRGEVCDTCGGEHEVDVLAPLDRLVSRYRLAVQGMTLAAGELRVQYVRGGELCTAKFWDIEAAMSFLDTLNSPEARSAPRGRSFDRRPLAVG